jgi:hypothetical protein
VSAAARSVLYEATVGAAARIALARASASTRTLPPPLKFIVSWLARPSARASSASSPGAWPLTVASALTASIAVTVAARCVS